MAMKRGSRKLSPYWGGALTGVVAVLSVWIAGKFLGASTTFARTAGMIMKVFSPERVNNMPYFVRYSPKIDWQWMFLLGLLIGSFVAARLSRTFRWQAVPTMWQERFGNKLGGRAIVAFLGGILAVFGARLAGGCPTGHGLSGIMQLSISGFISVICFFASGIVVARLIYGKGGRK